jgi:hypothetical protein
MQGEMERLTTQQPLQLAMKAAREKWQPEQPLSQQRALNIIEEYAWAMADAVSIIEGKFAAAAGVANVWELDEATWVSLFEAHGVTPDLLQRFRRTWVDTEDSPPNPVAMARLWPRCKAALLCVRPADVEAYQMLWSAAGAIDLD